ncbi:MAG: hypothetical protein ACI9OI_000451, partial [Chitinophagales bacterium]
PSVQISMPLRIYSLLKYGFKTSVPGLKFSAREKGVEIDHN